MDDRLGPFEGGGIDLPAGRIPGDLAGCTRSATHEPHDVVTARVQKGDELAPDQSGGAG